MDQHHFNAWTRSVRSVPSRRDILRGLASASAPCGCQMPRQPRRSARRTRSAGRRTAPSAPAATMAAVARVARAEAIRSVTAERAVCRSRGAPPVPAAAAPGPTTVDSRSPAPPARPARSVSAMAAAPSTAPTTRTAPPAAVLAAAAIRASKARITALAASFNRRCHARARPTARPALTARTSALRRRCAFQSATRRKAPRPGDPQLYRSHRHGMDLDSPEPMPEETSCTHSAGPVGD